MGCTQMPYYCIRSSGIIRYLTELRGYRLTGYMIIAAASDFGLGVSSDGLILSVVVNSHGDTFGNLERWKGRAVTEFLTRESIAKFEKAHATCLLGEVRSKQLDLNHCHNAVWQYPVRYTFHRFDLRLARQLFTKEHKMVFRVLGSMQMPIIAATNGASVSCRSVTISTCSE